MSDGFRPRLWDWMFPNLRLIAYLHEELGFWRAQAAHERMRAEHAIDQLLAMRSLGPVVPPPAPPPDLSMMQELRELGEEFAQAGHVTGAPSRTNG